MLCGNAEGSGTVAVNVQIHLRIFDLEVAGHVLNHRKSAQLRLKCSGVGVKVFCIRTLKDELVLGFGKCRFQTYRGRVLHEHHNAGHPHHLGPEALYYLVGIQLALTAGLELKEHEAAV